jgi:hypothetical protein
MKHNSPQMRGRPGHPPPSVGDECNPDANVVHAVGPVKCTSLLPPAAEITGSKTDVDFREPSRFI